MVVTADGSHAPLSKLSSSDCNVLYLTLKYQELIFINYNNFIHALSNSSQSQPLSDISLTVQNFCH